MSILLHSWQMGKVGWLVHEKNVFTRKHLMYQKVTARQLKVSLISSINDGHHESISFFFQVVSLEMPLQDIIWDLLFPVIVIIVRSFPSGLSLLSSESQW